MQLWNDYEGRTIAEAYPLEKLLSPEGRSAFFSTSNGTGTPAVIRLIESHFDEDEILARWRKVAKIQEPHLIALRKCGQTEIDGTSLVYAVMEPTDDNLAEVLKQRALTPWEAREAATSLVAALQALHSHNLAHEHIEPSNVLANGAVIKLRSDCVRDVPMGEEGASLRAQDVHNLALVLLQAITLRTTLPSTPLPAPFDAIIRNGMSGAWGLAEISAALKPAETPVPVVAAPTPSAPASAVAAPATSAAKTSRSARIPPSSSESDPFLAPKTAPKVSDRLIKPVEEMPSRPRGLWIACGVAVLLLVVLLWRHFSAAPATTVRTSSPQASLASSSQPAAPLRPKPSASEPVAAPSEAAIPPSTAPSSGAPRSQWRVVAYTFNRLEQAQQKAKDLATRYEAFHPDVFTPTGKAPYLVTLGGAMDRDQAMAVRNQARAQGLPRDTYSQNYSR